MERATKVKSIRAMISSAANLNQKLCVDECPVRLPSDILRHGIATLLLLTLFRI